MKSILFNTEMVKAILDGRKTQTRRVFSKTQIKYFDYAQKLGEMNSLDDLHENDFSYILQFSKYQKDDILYIRETFIKCDINGKETILFKAYGHTELDVPWTPPVHMKKEDARIFLKVTNVRVERLQEAELEDICEEGYPEGYQPSYFTSDSKRELHENKMDDWWINLWNSTAKDGYKWEDNPYVFVYEFEKTTKES